MRYLVRSVSGHVDGVGHVRAGVITSVPDHLADALLASGEWRDTEARSWTATADAEPDDVIDVTVDDAARLTEVPKPRKVAEPAKRRKGR